MGSQVTMEGSSPSDWRTDIGVADSVKHLYTNKPMSDITFTFPDQESIKAHKLILGMRSAVFEAMFYGTMAEKNSEVSINDIESDIFDMMLQFIYTNNVDVTGESVIWCLYAGKKYCIEGLVKLCKNFLENSISTNNVCTIFEQAKLFELKDLVVKCENYMEKNAVEVAQNNDFENLSQDSLRCFLAYPKIKPAEIEYFMAVNRWAEAKCKAKKIEVTPANKRTELGDVINEIKFGLLSPEELAKNVRPTQLLTADEQAEIYPWIILKTWPSEDILNNFPSVPRETADICVNIPKTIVIADIKLQNKVVVKISPSHSIQVKSIGIQLPSAIENVKLVVEDDKDDSDNDTNDEEDISAQIQTATRTIHFKKLILNTPGKTYTLTFNLKRCREYYNEDVQCLHYERSDERYVHGGVYIKLPEFTSNLLKSITYAVNVSSPEK